MKFVPKVKFNDSFRNAISFSVDEDLVDGEFIMGR